MNFATAFILLNGVLYRGLSVVSLDQLQLNSEFPIRWSIISAVYRL